MFDDKNQHENVLGPSNLANRKYPNTFDQYSRLKDSPGGELQDSHIYPNFSAFLISEIIWWFPEIGVAPSSSYSWDFPL